MWLILFLASLIFLSRPAFCGPDQSDFYVSPAGCDTNPGTESAPFGSIEGARNLLRTISRDNTRVTVWIEPGEYVLPSTIEFDERDGGMGTGSVTYRSRPGGEVIFSGGIRVTGWTRAENGLWKAPLNRDVKLRSLYVNGRRALMAGVTGSASRSGEYRVTAGQSSWAWDSGSKSDGSVYTDIPMIRRNPEDVEITNFQLWNCNTVCVREVVQDGRKVTLKYQEPYGAIAQTCYWANFSASGRHQVRNAYEFLREPGQFYFDKAAKTLYYIPRSDEDLTRAPVIAPRLEHLLLIRGKDPEHPVRNLTIQGIEFCHSDWNLAEIEGSHGKATVQGACYFKAFTALEVNCHGDLYRNLDVPPGAIECEHCDHIDFIRNRIEHIGAEGFALPNDANNVRIEGNVICDVAGSGVLVGHPQHVFEGDPKDHVAPGGAGAEKEKYLPSMERVCRDNVVQNNLIKDCTQEFYGEAAVSAFYVQGLKVEHNVIDHVAFNGVSMGWGWGAIRKINGRDATVSKNNSISFNRFHRVMQRLNDSGAIYTLGEQPGTVVTGNYIQGVGSTDFPTIKRYGIHHDNGSAFITTRHNVLDIAPEVWSVHAFRWGGEHDVIVEDLHTTTLRSAQGGGSNKLSGYHFYPDNIWSLAAYEIILGSGIQPDFLDILPPGEPPDQDIAFPASVMVQPGTVVPMTPLPFARGPLVLARDTPHPSKVDIVLSIPLASSSIKAPDADGRYKVCAADSSGMIHPSGGVLVVKSGPARVTGVKEGGCYDHPVVIHAEGSGILDDDPTTLGSDFTVVRNGSHRLSVLSANGVTNTVSFSVNFPQEWIDADRGRIEGKAALTSDPAFSYRLMGPFGANSSVSYTVPRNTRLIRVVYASSGNDGLKVLIDGQHAGELKGSGTLAPGVGQIPTFRVAELPVACKEGSTLTFFAGARNVQIFLRAIVFSDESCNSALNLASGGMGQSGQNGDQRMNPQRSEKGQ